jgi:hypothetical protein
MVMENEPPEEELSIHLKQLMQPMSSHHASAENNPPICRGQPVGSGLPLNPQKFPGFSWDLALSTAISFVTQAHGSHTPVNQPPATLHR